jgi:hypothetical protein
MPVLSSGSHDLPLYGHTKGGRKLVETTPEPFTADDGMADGRSDRAGSTEAVFAYGRVFLTKEEDSCETPGQHNCQVVSGPYHCPKAASTSRTIG